MRQVVIADASQLSCFDECEVMWELGYHQSLTAITGSDDDPMDAGTYGHKLMEIYYRNAKRLGKPEAFKLALNYDIHSHPEAKNGRFPLSDKMIARVKERFLHYYAHYTVIGDYDICYNKKNIISTSGSLLIDESIEEPLIEKGFSIPLLDTPEYLFILEGKIDMIAITPFGPAFVDNKWQFRERNLYPKSIQFKCYALATGLKHGVINYIRMKQNLDATTLIRQPIAFSIPELRYWKEECIAIFHRIAKSLRTNEYIHRWNACDGKFGYKCEFTPICDEWNLRIKNAVIQTNFRKRPEWRPW